VAVWRGCATVAVLLALTGCAGEESSLSNGDLARALSEVLAGTAITCEDSEAATGASFNRRCTFTKEEATSGSSGEQTPRASGDPSRLGGSTTTTPVVVEIRVRVDESTWCEVTVQLPQRYHCP
jgi:hypothetical protein